MVRMIMLLIAFCFFMCTVIAAEEECAPNFPEIQFDLNREGREWIIGHQVSNERLNMLEYILKGESIEHWTEIVTVQSFKSIQTNPDEFFHLFIKELQKSFVSNQINFKVLKSDPTFSLGEWWIADSSPNDQHEWIKIFVTPGFISAVRYTTRHSLRVEAIRKKWETIIGNASVEYVENK